MRKILYTTDSETLARSASATKQRWRNKYEPAIRALHDRGVSVVGSFMIGSDTDSEGVGRATAQWAIEQNLDTAIFYVLTPLPGTRLFSRLQTEGRILTHDWRQYDVTYCVFDPDGTKTPDDGERASAP